MMDYDSWAQGYDELHRSEQVQKLKIVKKLLGKKQGGKILDIGSGTGISAEILSGTLFGVEPSPVMLDISLKKRLPKFHVFLGKGENLEGFFENNFFDAAICISSAHHFDDVKSVLRQMIAVSKRDALFCFSMLKRSDSFQGLFSEIRIHFDILKQVEEQRDLIVLFRNKKHKL